MRVLNIEVQPDFRLVITSSDGHCGMFDVTPYLDYEIFAPLKEPAEFAKVRNGGYFIEWECGADLSADTLEARMILIQENSNSTYQKSGTEKAGADETAPNSGTA